MEHAYLLKLWKLKYYLGHFQRLISWRASFFNKASPTLHDPPSPHEPLNPCNLCSGLHHFSFNCLLVNGWERQKELIFTDVVLRAQSCIMLGLLCISSCIILILTVRK